MALPDEYYKAGEIASKVRSEIRGRVRIGMGLLEIAETVESSILAKGGDPAFPCNICINNVAAHYTPTSDDKSVVENGVLLKIDIGVHVGGFLVDTATTLSFNPEYDAMIMAAENVLSEAVKTVRSGVRAGDIGRVISSVASRWGYQTIRNLSGHLIEPYRVHGGLSIPNIWVTGTQELKAGQVYAIEPFLTFQDGAGLVIDNDTSNIYSLVTRRKTGDRQLDEFVEHIWCRFRTLPFTPRYFTRINSNVLKEMLNRLIQLKTLRRYPVLVEAKGKPVAQAEHTVALCGEKVIVLT